ncbi:MAG: hypothetical protein ER33_11885 [Cyanobium sp. CACIAM 14]|nr:MAG: hypothetical protein ER33_11885 [Cyanobium sp. CACIAM 14]
MNRVIQASRPPLLPDPPGSPPGTGFTLVEILVGAVLLAIVGSLTALVFSVSNRSTVSSTAIANANAAIDTDVSRIKEVAERFTCCSGTCTADATAIATAVAAGTCAGSVGDSTYYFPQNPDTNTTATANFTSACASGLTTNLISQIPAASLPAGISRAVQDDGDATARRIRITYTGGGVNRVVKIVPTVASWCP